MTHEQIGLIVVAAAAGAAILIAILRWATVPRECKTLPWHYWTFVILSVGVTVAATVGFRFLLTASSPSGTDYSGVLNVLGLLSAGVIAGFFAFSFQDAASSEGILPNVISMCFALLFFVLFGSVCYFLGQWGKFNADTHVNTLVPVVMGLVLVGNVLYDFHDYVTVDGE